MPGLKRKPIIPNDQTPDEIIGVKNMGLMETHFMAAVKCSSKEDYDKAMKKFTEIERNHIAEIYSTLRELGIWPDGLDGHGNIKWGIMVRSDLQNVVESHPLIDRRNFHISTKFGKISYK